MEGRKRALPKGWGGPVSTKGSRAPSLPFRRMAESLMRHSAWIRSLTSSGVLGTGGKRVGGGVREGSQKSFVQIGRQEKSAEKNCATAPSNLWSKKTKLKLRRNSMWKKMSRISTL